MKTILITFEGNEHWKYPIGPNFIKTKAEIIKCLKAFNTVEEFKDKPINIFCMGSSGNIIATIFANKLKNSIIIPVRKAKEFSHSGNFDLHKHYNNKAINLIVDDFIDTGETMSSIITELQLQIKKSIKIDCVAILGYDKSNLLEFKPTYFISRKTW